MTNKEFCIQLEKRTKLFAITILKLTASLPYTPESKVIKHQLSKSGTSVGANYREANRARSSRDFKHKITICESEATESCYWLEIIEEMKWLTPLTTIPILKESNELLAIFTSIGTSLDKKKRNTNNKQ